MTAQAEEDLDPYECDLPGCDQVVTYEPDEEEGWPREPPPGWYSIVVARNGAQHVAVMYCCQEHLGLGVTQHLPEASPPSNEQSGWRDNAIGCVMVVAFVTVLLLGLFTAGALLFELIGWLADRM